jgi:hypothetical protein
MDSFFDAKFYENAMSSIFACHLGRDIPERCHGRLGGARSDTSNRHCGKYVCPRAELQQADGACLHCTAHPSYAPRPLPGWTSDEQLSLIAAIKTVPNERSLMIEHYGWTEEVAHHKYLLLMSDRVPGKSLQEVERCLRHLEAKRVAFFGQHHS